MKITVISAITGNRDTLKEFEKEDGVDYVCFMDHPIKSDTWQTIKIESDELDPVRRAKPYKITPEMFVDSDYSIWIDGNVILNVAPSSLVDSFLERNDIALFDHGVRNCIYDEAITCISLGLDNPDTITKQMLDYEMDNYPEQNGLSYCGVIFRKHTPKVFELNQMWWDEIKKGSRRDQLSFPYVAWKTDIGVGRIQGINPHDKNIFFERTEHAN